MNVQYSNDGLTDLYDFFLNAPIGLHILDKDYVIRLANEADLRITGYSDEPSAYVGRRVTDFYADTALADEMLSRLAGGSLLVNFHAQLRRRDGSEQPVVINSNSRLKDGSLLNVRCFAFPDPSAAAAPRDTSASTQRPADLLETMTESERQELFDLLDDFFENAPVALHIVGPDGLIRRANRMELESLGYQDAPELYVGHHISEFHADQSVIDEMLERLVGGRPLIHYQARLVRRDGETMPVVIYSSPRFNDSQFVNTRCFTFPQTVDDTMRTPGYSWPRNDADALPADADPLTVALRRMAGRKSAEESLGFLAETSKALEASDYVEGVSAVCRLAAPFLADWCSVELSTGDGAARTLGTARGSIAGSDDLVRALATRERQNGGGRHALRVPFETGEGASGALLLVRDGGRDAFGPADVALAEEVARRVAVAVAVGCLRETLALRR
jgi:PAS domain S-box-containing protein